MIDDYLNYTFAYLGMIIVPSKDEFLFFDESGNLLLKQKGSFPTLHHFERVGGNLIHVDNDQIFAHDFSFFSYEPGFQRASYYQTKLGVSSLDQSLEVSYYQTNDVSMITTTTGSLIIDTDLYHSTESNHLIVDVLSEYNKTHIFSYSSDDLANSSPNSSQELSCISPNLFTSTLNRSARKWQLKISVFESSQNRARKIFEQIFQEKKPERNQKIFITEKNEILSKKSEKIQIYRILGKWGPFFCIKNGSNLDFLSKKSGKIKNLAEIFGCDFLKILNFGKNFGILAKKSEKIYFFENFSDFRKKSLKKTEFFGEKSFFLETKIPENFKISLFFLNFRKFLIFCVKFENFESEKYSIFSIKSSNFLEILPKIESILFKFSRQKNKKNFIDFLKNSPEFSEFSGKFIDFDQFFDDSFIFKLDFQLKNKIASIYNSKTEQIEQFYVAGLRDRNNIDEESYYFVKRIFSSEK